MSQDKDEKPRSLGLSPAQVVGSALAAMSVAFFASWAGTAGPMIGAAVGSVIATVGAATYTWSLRRTSEAAKRTAALVRQRALLTGTHARVDPGAERPDPDAPVPDPNAPAPASGESDSADPADDAEPGGRLAALRELPWLKVTLASLAVLVAALGGITAIELVTGKPISSLLGKDGGSGTTVGHVTRQDHTSTPKDEKPKDQTPATPGSTPSQAPSEGPQQPAPSSTPKPSPSAPASPEPSTSPSPDTLP